MSRFMLVGEALVDVISDGSGTRTFPGGSPLNVAVGLARLGHDATLVTRIGTDEHGAMIDEYLAKSGVRLADGAVDDQPTSVAAATLDSEGRASYQFELDWRLPDVVSETAVDHLHFGSIGAYLAPGADQVADLVRRQAPDATISFDPNLRPAIIGARDAALSRTEDLIRACDVVKISDEDLSWLLPSTEPVEVARHWLTLGPAIVVVTLGGQGAFAVAGDQVARVAAPAVDVVDTVGAGDAYMSGFLDALAAANLIGAGERLDGSRVDSDRLTQLVEQAVRVSALTCTRAGANPPTRDELDRWVPGSA